MVTRLVRIAALATTLLIAVAAATEDRRSVAVLPVVVHSIGDQAYLQSGVADMLASRLGRTPGVGVIRISDPAVATTDLNAAQKAARDVGADYVLYGSFTHFGEGASLDIRCARASETGEAKGIFIQSGTLGELIPRIDTLAEKVGRYVTGSSLPAVAAASETNDSSGNEDPTLQARVEALEAAVAELREAGASP